MNASLTRPLLDVYHKKLDLNDVHLEKAIDHFFQTLTSYVKEKGFRKFSPELIQKTQQLRTEVLLSIERGELDPAILVSEPKRLMEDHLKGTSWSSLQKALVLVWDVVKDINSSAFGPEVWANQEGLAQGFHQLNYFGELLNLSLPGKELPTSDHTVTQVMDFLGCSLTMEILLVLGEMSLDGDELVPESAFRELALEILATTEKYAAYTIFLGLWTPEETDQRPLVENSRIVAATFHFPPVSLT